MVNHPRCFVCAEQYLPSSPRPHHYASTLSDGSRNCHWRAVQAVLVQISSDCPVRRNIFGKKADDYGLYDTLVKADQDIHMAEATNDLVRESYLACVRTESFEFEDGIFGVGILSFDEHSYLCKLQTLLIFMKTC